MILIDTSVPIGYMRGSITPKVALFEQVLAHNFLFGISVFTYQEVLQGAKDKAE